jgi:phage terminase large subunit-like protein
LPSSSPVTTPSFSLTLKQEEAFDILAGEQRNTCLVGGSRSGKTFVAVRAIVVRALKAPGSRHTILRLRFNAVRAAVALDTLPKVMKLCFPNSNITEHRQDGYFKFDNGSEIWIGGLDEKERVEKILGQEYASILFNECSQIPYNSVVIALTRLAQNCDVTSDGMPLSFDADGKPNNHIIGKLSLRAYYDLNPTGLGHWTNKLFGEKRLPGSLRPLGDPENYVRLFMNPRDNLANLPPGYIQTLETLPDRYRKRFLDGVYVSETDGALWTFDVIERCRVEDLPVADRKRIVIAVDPSGAKDKEDTTSDEIGIIVVALGQDGHGYVLADRTVRDGPAGWGKAVVNAYREFGADRVIAETNYGGEMVRFVIKTADPNVPVSVITASRGKAVRAEPVSAIYEQNKVHHVGRFESLEDQMCSFTTNGYMGEASPDRADALVWALSFLMIGDTNTGILDFYVAEAAKLAAAQVAGTARQNQIPTADNGGVLMAAPAGTSTVYGLGGRKYTVGNDLRLTVETDDVKALQAVGFVAVLA